MISFLNELIESGSQRQVTVVHADRRLDTWPLREEMTELIEKTSSRQAHLVHRRRRNWRLPWPCGHRKAGHTCGGERIPVRSAAVHEGRAFRSRGCRCTGAEYQLRDLWSGPVDAALIKATLA